MNRIIFNLFPEGRDKALTMSYDDGQIHDRRLVELFNQYGIKGSFHINSKLLDFEPYINASEVKSLYEGHEVSVHTQTHPSLVSIPSAAIYQEIVEDKRALERLVGYPVRGMSYPFGLYDDQIKSLLTTIGIEYARTVHSTNKHILSEDFMEWQPTTHHNDGLLEKGQCFLDDDKAYFPKLMYVWGHSYEFDRNDNWPMMESFCQLVGNRDDIWYASNIEIVDYTKALRALLFTVEQDVVYNPTVQDVWFTCNGEAVLVKSGETKKL